MSIRRIIVLAIASFMILNAIFPLLGKRYIPTHDGEYHIIRIVEFVKMLKAGYLFPRWAPDLNSGYGIPIFQYHYPLPNYVGSFFHFITHDAVYAFQQSSAVAYILLVAGLYFWLRYFFSFEYALFGSLIASYTPYVFLDMYVRGAIGEVWAMGFTAYTLGFLERKKYAAASICFAFLILSHNILAMLFGMLFGVYSLVRKRSPIYLLTGILLSAYFWIPAIFEQKYVVGLNTVTVTDHFVQLYEFLIPSWGSEFSATGSMGNKMSFQIGLIPLLLMLSSVFALLRESNARLKQVMIFFAVWLFNLILLFPFTAPIWELFAPLRLVQYPWRLLSFVIPVTALFASYVLQKKSSVWVTVGILSLTVILTWKYVRPVSYEPRRESYYIARKNFTDGTSSMGNSFSTIWTPWKSEKPGSEIAVSNGSVVKQSRSEYLYKEYEVEMLLDGEVIFHTLYFPGWSASVDRKSTSIEYKEDGIIHVPVSGGKHTVSLRYQETPVRWIADGISIASFLIVMIWGILPSIL